MIKINRRNQMALLACIDRIQGLDVVVRASSGNFMAIDVTQAGLKAEDVVRATLAAGFVIRSGAYTSSRVGSKFVRVATSVPPADLDRFCTILPDVIASIPRRS